MANYADDFASSSGELTDGWQYQWNAPLQGDATSNSIDAPNAIFTPMNFTGVHTSWTPDGDLIPSNNPESAYVRLSANGGHPGPAENVSRVTRYAIASYTVPESGFYEIRDSFIGLNPTNPAANSDGVEFRVFVNNDAPLEYGTTGQGSRSYFDTHLGFLRTGDTVHVAYGANGNQSYDYFTTDFSVVRDTQLEQTTDDWRRISQRSLGSRFTLTMGLFLERTG